jgi:hypothetical protein
MTAVVLLFSFAAQSSWRRQDPEAIMEKWMRRIRGAVGIGFTWAAAWKAASLAWGDVLAIVPTFALASAVCASGSLALARRATIRELPDSVIEHEKLAAGGD